MGGTGKKKRQGKGSLWIMMDNGKIRLTVPWVLVYDSANIKERGKCMLSIVAEDRRSAN